MFSSRPLLLIFLWDFPGLFTYYFYGHYSWGSWITYVEALLVRCNSSILLQFVN